MMEGFFIYTSSKHIQDLCLEDQIDCRQYNTAGHTEDHCTSDTLMGVFLFSSTKADTDIGTAAVTDHNSNSQSYYRQRENNCICCISVRSKITGICNKNLVDNIIKRSDQK